MRRKPSAYKRSDNADTLKKTLKALTKRDVLVGIPAEAGTQPGSPISLAAVGYIQEMGSPANNIPSRPFLRPAVAASKDRIVEQMKKATDAAFKGDAAGVSNAQNATGLIVVAKAKELIVAGIPPALSPVTLYRRQHRSDQPNSRTTPLSDKGDLFRSITYVISERKSHE